MDDRPLTIDDRQSSMVNGRFIGEIHSGNRVDFFMGRAKVALGIGCCVAHLCGGKFGEHAKLVSASPGKGLFTNVFHFIFSAINSYSYN